MFIDQFFSCSFSLGLSVSPVNRPQFSLFRRGHILAWVSMDRSMLWLVFLYLLIPKTEPGIWKKTVCLVRGWVDGWVNQHFQVEMIRQRWCQRPAGEWGGADSGLPIPPRAPVIRDCPVSLLFRSYLWLSALTQYLKKYKSQIHRLGWNCIKKDEIKGFSQKGISRIIWWKTLIISKCPPPPKKRCFQNEFTLGNQIKTYVCVSLGVVKLLLI